MVSLSFCVENVVFIL